MGCGEKTVYLTGPTTTKTDTVVVTAGMQTVNLRVDWNKLRQVTTSKFTDGMVYAVSDSTLNITHVGSRLVYAKNNAVFTQSVTKNTSDTSLITLQVPPTDTAHLYVLAVYESNGVYKALKMGVKRNIRIFPNTPINLTLDSLTLTDTDWILEDTTLVVSKDTINVTASNELSERVVNIRVTDPYQIGTQFISYSNRIVKFFGSGYEYPNVNGWRRFGISVRNDSTTTSINKFWPYIDGSLFNLNGEYVIGKEGIIKITWN
jgi:hypothetical protein